MNQITAKPSVSEAMTIVEDAVASLGREVLPVDRALGRSTIEPVCAKINMPRFAASAMDGFALRSFETRAASPDRPVELQLGEPVLAGRWPGTLPPAGSVPIATGAPVPEGADAVIVREGARIERRGGRDHLRIETPIEAGRNVRARGEDMVRGMCVAPAGTIVTPDVIGAFISCGVARIAVHRLPRIAILSTGSELVADRATLDDPAKLIDSNGPMIRASAMALGLPVIFTGRAADRREPLEALLATATGPGAGDIVISTGGVSAGDADLVRDGLASIGAVPMIHGIRMRPGKPLLFAVLPDGRPFFGLPGNPVAALIGFRFFVLAAIRRMLSLPRERGTMVEADVEPRDATTLFLRARVFEREDGVHHVDTQLDQRSHVLSSVTVASHWLRVERGDVGVSRVYAYPKMGSLVA